MVANLFRDGYGRHNMRFIKETKNIWKIFRQVLYASTHEDAEEYFTFLNLNITVKENFFLNIFMNYGIDQNGVQHLEMIF